MTMHLLRAADPAAAVNPEPDLGLLADIVAQPRRRTAPRPLRRIAIGVTATSAGAVAAIVVLAPRQGGSDLGDAAFRVTRSSDGTVSAQIRWDRVLADPSALQAALDHAHARTKVFVLDAGARECSNDTTTGYSDKAVEFHVPHATAATDGLVVHPRYFPVGGTFVIVMRRAAPGTTATGGPGAPAIAGYDASMVLGRVTDPMC